MGALKVLNPALRPPVWNGSRAGAARLCAAPAGRAVRRANHRRLGTRTAVATLPGAAQRRRAPGAPWRDPGRHRRGERYERRPAFWPRTAGMPRIRSRAAMSCGSRCRLRGRRSQARRPPPWHSRRTLPRPARRRRRLPRRNPSRPQRRRHRPRRRPASRFRHARRKARLFCRPVRRQDPRTRRITASGPAIRSSCSRQRPWDISRTGATWTARSCAS